MRETPTLKEQIRKRRIESRDREAEREVALHNTNIKKAKEYVLEKLPRELLSASSWTTAWYIQKNWTVTTPKTLKIITDFLDANELRYEVQKQQYFDRPMSFSHYDREDNYGEVVPIKVYLDD